MNKFFYFSQNNSGGVFLELEGDFCDLIVEAADADEANAIAESVGVYFDGCYTGDDCECCGDRWYRVDNSDGCFWEEMYESYKQKSLVIRKK